MEMSKRGKTLDKQEVDYIRSNCFTSTDEKIANDLGRDVRTITSYRKKLGIEKKNGGALTAVRTAGNESYVIASRRLNEDDRKSFFKDLLCNSLYYDRLKEQFTEDEISFYLEEWAGLCLQFEDVLATEKRQIDEYIKQQIIGNRIMRNIKTVEEEIEKVIVEVENFRRSHDMKNDEDAQERDIQLTNLIRMMSVQSQAMTKDYQNNVTLKNNILAELNARRADRIDQIARRGTTFLSLIEAFRDKDVREAHGKHMELVKLAKEKKRKEWSKPSMFADGTKDCILMDENAQINYVEGEELFPSEIISRYMEIANNKILVVEDDASRQQIFQKIFNKHYLNFASNVDKAIEKLNEKQYDLIMLDYDIGLNQKSDLLVEKMIEANLAKSSEFIIHSMNRDGADLLFEKLSKYTDKIDICPFEHIIKIYSEKINA